MWSAVISDFDKSPESEENPGSRELNDSASTRHSNDETAEDRSDRLARISAGQRFDDVTWTPTSSSTNADLIEAARSGAREQVRLTDFQSAGRGRRDRSWSAPPGTSLILSVLLRERAPGQPLSPDTAGGLTMALGLGAVEACQELCGVRPTLKWPNDLVYEDRKLAGVLAEGVIEDGQLTAVVIGMGLNANWPELPAELTDIAVSLNHLAGHEVDRVALARLVLNRFEHWVAEDPATLRARYVECSATIGRQVRAELPDGDIVGLAVGITEVGHLELDTIAGRRTMHVGDVVHLRPVENSDGP